MNAFALRKHTSIESYELKTGKIQCELNIADLVYSIQLAWSWLGDSSKPVIVVLGGISADRYVSYDELTEQKGWWDNFVGKNKVIDTNLYSVLSFDYVGGCASTKLLSKEKFKSNINTADQAKALTLIMDQLGINKLHCIIGSSYGGMVSLAFCELFPERIQCQIIISAADKSHPRSTALRQIQRGIVKFGIETGKASQGLSLARQLGMITYRSKNEFLIRYDSDCKNHRQQHLSNYLEFNGKKFARNFSPHSFLCLSESIDNHQVNPRKIKVPSQLISVDSDELVFSQQMETLTHKLAASANHKIISSNYGHDAFLKEHELLKPIIRSVLEAGND